jgi:uncharacterized protein (DUF2384 family)
MPDRGLNDHILRFATFEVDLRAGEPPENVRAWMNSPHPDLRGRTPIQVIREGKARAVSDLLESALAGQPS